MKRTDIRLCSYMYPLWLLSVLPPYLVISVPANFVLDSLALFLVIWLLKLENRWQFFKNHFGKVFFFGFLSDFLAGALMICAYSAGLDGFDVYSPLLKIPGFLIAVVLVLLSYYFLVFPEQEKGMRWKLTLLLAIPTVPYTFLFPLK